MESVGWVDVGISCQTAVAATAIICGSHVLLSKLQSNFLFFKFLSKIFLALGVSLILF